MIKEILKKLKKRKKQKYKLKIKKSKLSYKTKKVKKKKIRKKVKLPKYNLNTYRENKDIKNEIEKRYNILTVFIILLLLILIIGLFLIQVIGKEKYEDKLEKLTKKIVYGPSAPRGRIYDRNGKLIVDNVPMKVIYYKKPSEVTTKEEIDIAYKLADMIDLENKIKDYDLKTFWIKNNKEKAKSKITKKEWKKYDERKMSLDDIYKLEIERVTEEQLNDLLNSI